MRGLGLLRAQLQAGKLSWPAQRRTFCLGQAISVTSASEGMSALMLYQPRPPSGRAAGCQSLCSKLSRGAARDGSCAAAVPCSRDLHVSARPSRPLRSQDAISGAVMELMGAVRAR